ncbi:uncharacterized protein LOC131080018 isoform X1 [Cryptomeria japonica]|uniref:uncharacterized protein LOC131080018 isoform X1 n=1 Tax=Cryptomeria japonica TaxID=3369 RepID=UPI0027D9FE5D|nr:uncharacterized protein LOC131080018 isoform X1 [Cryptomeria japonica]
MVRKLQIKDSINFLEPQAAFSFLFGDDRFFKKYHSEVNGDDDAEASNWSEDGTREVRYTTPLSASNFILKVAGTDKLKVREKQEYKRCGNCFTIISNPIIDIPGGERFVTRGELILSPGEKDQGCFLTINISLEFKSNVWGLQGSVEAFMEAIARRSFVTWMKMASNFCREQLNLSSEGLPELEIDEYFDAEDIERPSFFDGIDESRRASSQTGNFLASLFRENGRDAEPDITLQTWFIRSVLRDLNRLQISGEASHTHLEKMNAMLQRMEHDVSYIKMCLNERRGLVSQGTTLGLFGMGVATGMIFAHLYFKHKQHS